MYPPEVRGRDGSHQCDSGDPGAAGGDGRVDALANRLSIPPPLVLVPAGLILGFIPWFPRIELNPEMVLFVFLPPLIYTGAFSTRQALRENLRPILLLSFGLVLFTLALVAAVAHALIPGMSWPVAFVLGAIVAPTDDVAAATIVRRLSLPHRIVTVLEGEGLLNDAMALTAFRFALAAVISGSFSFRDASFSFLTVVFGKAGYGLALGWLLSRIRQRLKDPSLEITVSFLTPSSPISPRSCWGEQAFWRRRWWGSISEARARSASLPASG